MVDAVGVMGGTFDPIHLGHLVAAEEARLRFALDQVVFVPNGDPPHKQAAPVSSGEHRYAMALLATASNEWFICSRAELDGPGPFYTVDTMRLFREALGPRCRLYFITGADAMLETLTWRQPEEIARLCEFIAVARPGYDLQRLSEALSPEVLRRVHVLDIPGMAISSTEMRRRAAAGEPLRYLVPTAVAHYIETNGLYAGTAPRTGPD